MSARVSLQARVEQYLCERRLLGFKLRSMGHGLPSFARYVAVADDVVAAVFNLLTPDDPIQPYAAVTAVTAAQWGAVPRTVIKCLQDAAILPAMADKMIADADAFTPGNKAQVLSLNTSHSPFSSQPQALADMLLVLA